MSHRDASKKGQGGNQLAASESGKSRHTEKQLPPATFDSICRRDSLRSQIPASCPLNRLTMSNRTLHLLSHHRMKTSLILFKGRVIMLDYNNLGELTQPVASKEVLDSQSARQRKNWLLKHPRRPRKGPKELSGLWTKP